MINSGINDFVKNRSSLAECQVLIDSKANRFVTHDSYIACHQAIDVVHINEIEDQLLSNMERIKDEVSEDVRDKVIEAVKISRTLSKRNKDLILRSILPPA